MFAWLFSGALLIGICRGQAMPSVGVQGSNPEGVKAAERFNVDLLLAETNANDDNIISQDELNGFVRALDTNGDGSIRRCEFVDTFTSRYNASGPVANFLFTIVNSPSNDLPTSAVFTTQDFNLLLADSNNDGQTTLTELRTLILMDVYKAAVRATQHVDLIIANSTTVLPPSGEETARRIDPNADGILSPDEIVATVPNSDRNGDRQISRCEWADAQEASGFNPAAVSLAFDLIDRNRDNFISESELIADLNAADMDPKDGRVTTSEYASYVEKNERITRRQVGVPVRDFKYTCDWHKNSWPITWPGFKVDLFVKDADENADGVVTQSEYEDVVITFHDWNGNTNLSRCEFVLRSTARYGVSRRQANAIFDALDRNRDDEISDYDVHVTVADHNEDGKTTVCELLLYTTYVTSHAEQAARRLASELTAERELLRQQVTERRLTAVHEDATLIKYLRELLRDAKAKPQPALWAWVSAEQRQQADLYRQFLQWLQQLVVSYDKHRESEDFKTFYELHNC